MTPSIFFLFAYRNYTIDDNIMNRSFNTMRGAGWCLCVRNLPIMADEHLLFKLFSPFGLIKRVDVIRNDRMQCGRGLAFITMNNYDDSVRAIHHLDGSMLFNRALSVSFKKKRRPRT